MSLSERIEDRIRPTIEDMGFRIVRVLVSGGRTMKLQIMAERADTGTISIDECADISRAVSALLDVEDPIEGAYTLEVSSPGIDRPLVRRDDFERYAGFDARVELNRPQDGRRRFKGRLKGMDGDAVLMDVDEGEVRLDLADIQKAKLLMTDDLLAASEERQKI
jgi:ribosome maturation factor RimP